MVICFNATAEAKKALDNLIDTRQFQDVSEAISMALINYQIIHSAVSSGQEMVLGTKPQESTFASEAKPQAATVSRISASNLPALFRLQSNRLDNLELAQVTPTARADGTILPPAKWLFGQYNKFLPVKATCRALLNLQQKQPAGVPLAEALDAIPKAAWELGDYLYSLDQRADRSREDSFAGAFPTTASNGAGSLGRFANQFIGDLRQPKQDENQAREIKFNGFPAALKFIACSDGKKPLLQLTTAGAEFAILENPTLDEGRNDTIQKFSEAEVDFLLAHIISSIPEETSAYVSLMDGIEEGFNTPDKVGEYLCRRFKLKSVEKAKSENEIAQTFLTTQRTGAISRMVDLALIEREKTGLRVEYRITGRGLTFRNQRG